MRVGRYGSRYYVGNVVAANHRRGTGSRSQLNKLTCGIIRASGQAFASVLRDGQPVEIPVTLGLRNDAFSEVTAGLAAGDSVAIVTTRQTISLFGNP